MQTFNEGRFNFQLTCHIEFLHDNVDTFLRLFAIFVIMGSYIPEVFFSSPSINKSFCEFISFSFTSHLVKWSSRIIFIQTDIFVSTQVCKFLVVTKTKEWCLITSKETFIILIWRKLNMLSFFIIKWKRIKSSFFVKCRVTLTWSS